MPMCVRVGLTWRRHYPRLIWDVGAGVFAWRATGSGGESAQQRGNWVPPELLLVELARETTTEFDDGHAFANVEGATASLSERRPGKARCRDDKLAVAHGVVYLAGPHRSVIAVSRHLRYFGCTSCEVRGAQTPSVYRRCAPCSLT